MKKIITLVLFVFLLTLCACAREETTSKNIGDESAVAREEIGETEDTAEDKKDIKIDRPTSDTSDGTGLPGTWVSEEKVEGKTQQLVLALNSDGTFEFYEDISGEGSALGNGTYTTEEDTLLLSFQETEDNFTNENTDVVFQENTNYTYKLDQTKLTLETSSGQSYEFARE